MTHGPGSWQVPAVMATLGPTLEKEEDLVRAIGAGAKWFRLPCGYRQRPHVDNARAVRSASAKAGVSVQLLLDLPSSRPRTGTMQELRLSPGDQVLFWDPEADSEAPSPGEARTAPLPGLRDLLSKLEPGHQMWFCDGRLRFVTEKIEGESVLTRLLQGLVPLKSSNSLFLPDSPSPFTPLTPPDCALLDSLAAAGVFPDWVALSLIASPEDVKQARPQLRAHLGMDPRVMAKFETVAAVECARAIIKQADPKADTSALEKEIDKLVYELYGLTEEEIKVVESE